LSPHGPVRVEQAGARGPRGDAEGLGDLRGGVPLEVVEHEDRALLCGEPPESALQLVPLDDRDEVVGWRWQIDRQHPKVRRAAALARRLRDADVNQESTQPRVEPIRIAEA